MAPAPAAIAKENPGATALLLLKERKWGEKNLDRAIGLLAEAARKEPIWLRSAVRLFRGRVREPETERALGMLWKVADSGILSAADFDLIAPEIRSLAKDVGDRRATRLLDPATWRELEFFELLAAAD
jgi:hypothetical protein